MFIFLNQCLEIILNHFYGLGMSSWALALHFDEEERACKGL